LTRWCSLYWTNFFVWVQGARLWWWVPQLLSTCCSWTELISLCQCKVTCFWCWVPQLLSRCSTLDRTNFRVSARWLASGDGYLSCCPDAAVRTEIISLCQCKVTCFWWWVPQLFSRCCTLDWTNFSVSVQVELHTSGTTCDIDHMDLCN